MIVRTASSRHSDAVLAKVDVGTVFVDGWDAVPRPKPDPSLPLFPMTSEQAHALVNQFGLEDPITSRMIFKHKGHPCCEGKKAKGHGPVYAVGALYLGNVTKARELEQARAIIRRELDELEQDPKVRRARELLSLGSKRGPRKARESTVAIPILDVVTPK